MNYIKNYLFGMAVIFAATFLRVWPLEALGSKLAWLTYYPAVMVAAIYGGIYVGITATILACIIVNFGWHFIISEPFIKNSTDLLGMAVFIMTCTMMSFVAESTRRANRVAKEEKEKAESANRAKSIFLANMSHELRTPLNAILGYTQLIQREKNITNEVSEYIKIISTSGEHLLELINEVLETAKIESGKVELEEANFNLFQTLNIIEEIFKEKSSYKGLELKFIINEKTPEYIYCDEKKLKIIIINLIGNAIKFTHKGHIYVKLFTEQIDNTVMLNVEVEDSGEGIEEQEREKLFKYFSRTKSGENSNEGTGIGLALSSEYVKMMGGKIVMEGNSYNGSTFKFNIKIGVGKKELMKNNGDVKRVKKIKDGCIIPKVIIAEDNNVNRELLSKLLKETGFYTFEARNGKEAVEIFNREEIDFIWMDIRMAVMDGKEATKIIKSKEKGKKVVIAALSAHVLGEEIKEIENAGCDCFVSKPFKEEQIFETMRKYIGIEYIYEEKENLQDKEIVKELDLEFLTGEEIEKLKEALKNTDSTKIIEIAKILEKDNMEMAKKIIEYAENFEYGKIKEALIIKNKGEN